MKKTIFGLFLTVNLYAQSYEVLLEEALHRNINLKLIHNQQEKISLSGAIERRYENPNLEFEVADFSSQFMTKSNSFGVRVGVVQSIPLPHIQKERATITEKRINLSSLEYKVERSNFIYNFNIRYLAYRKADASLALQSRAVELSKEILDTVNQRYQEGAVARSDYLEAKLDYQRAKTQEKRLAFDVVKMKNELLAFANLEKEYSVESGHIFLLEEADGVFPSIALGEARNEVSQAKLKLLEHSIESIELFSELEREPDQDVFRVGVSIPLPTFNLKHEEKQLEKINMTNEKLRIDNQENLLALQLEQLMAENRQLEILREHQQSLIASQEELFEMYKASYTIAKVNLLKLQQIKKQRILNQQKILENSFAIEQNIIKINYLQGGYSE